MTRIIESPAGKTITLMGDVEWLKKSKATEHALRMWNAGDKRFVIAALWEHGEFTDPSGSGRAMGKMIRWMYDTYGVDVKGGAIASMIRDDINKLAFERIGSTKRTTTLRLVAMPDTWYAKLQATLTDEIAPLQTVLNPAPPEPSEPASEAPAAIERPPVSVEPGESIDDEWQSITQALELDAPTVYDDPGPALDVEIAASVAMQLLTQVVEIIHAGSPEATDARVRKLQADIEDVSDKLSHRLSENDKMRKQLRETGDELKALRFERDGLRTRLKATETNLTRAMNGDTAKIINFEVQKRIDEFMRAVPASRKVADDAK